MPIATTDQIVLVKAPGVINETPTPATTLAYLNRLYQAIPDVKILLVVKNPIDRLVSHIVHECVQYGCNHHKERMPDVNDIIMGRAGEIKGRIQIKIRFNTELINVCFGISDLAFYPSN